MYDKFKQCLDGDALDTWEAIVVDEDKKSWDTNLAQLIDVLIDDEAFNNQKDYLNQTKKPANLPMKR